MNSSSLQYVNDFRLPTDFTQQHLEGGGWVYQANIPALDHNLNLKDCKLFNIVSLLMKILLKNNRVDRKENNCLTS